MGDMNRSVQRKMQLVQLEMLNVVDDICRKYNIVYYLSCGSLLGAVRNQGFIPWDDDIDVSMPYDSYLRFLSVAQNELGEKYFLQTEDTDPCWHRAYATIRKNNTTMLRNRKWRAHQGIWLDIFPIAGVRNRYDFALKKLIFKASNFVLIDPLYLPYKESFENDYGRPFCRLLDIFFIVPKSVRRVLHKGMTGYILNGKCDACATEVWCSLTGPLPGIIMQGPERSVLFEGRRYPTFPRYKTYLRYRYGKDYMIPVKYERALDSIVIDFDKDYTEYWD